MVSAIRQSDYQYEYYDDYPPLYYPILQKIRGIRAKLCHLTAACPGVLPLVLSGKSILVSMRGGLSWIFANGFLFRWETSTASRIIICKEWDVTGCMSMAWVYIICTYSLQGGMQHLWTSAHRDILQHNAQYLPRSNIKPTRDRPLLTMHLDQCVNVTDD